MDVPGRTAAHQEVQAHLVAAAAAEQLPDRRLQPLALEVPERDVDRADRAADDVPAERGHPVEVLPVVLDAHRVLADEVWREALHDLIDRLRVAPGRALAE